MECVGKRLMTPMNKNKIPILTLAYIGDAVYELWIRQYLVDKGCYRTQQLHQKAVKYVNAGKQSEFVALLEPFLDAEEKMLLKRGRNAKSGRQPKNMEMIDYRRATGLEALVGYLYLTNKKDRLEEIFNQLAKIMDQE